jgi:aspartyl protease family protein
MNFNNFNGGDWQNFTYLAVILMVLVASLLSRRELRLAKLLKYLAMWSVVGLVAVSIYAYRYDFHDFKNRILGEIAPANVRVNNSGELVINLAQDGHFYMDAKVNGVKLRFMIDTGASDVVIGTKEAEILGINLKKLIFNKVYQTANGKSLGATIVFDEVEVGGVKFNDIAASVNSSDMGTPLLGMSFLRQFKKYEFYQDKLVLTI